MEPTLYSDNILMTERISPRLNEIYRGDIIIAKNPSNPQQHICKRVIGLPGDKIVTQSSFQLNPFVRSGNSEATAAEYTDLSGNGTLDVQKLSGDEIDGSSMTQRTFKSNTVVVPRGHVWLEGDNVENSSDSRHYGPIPQGLIKSRAICRLWPPSEIRLL